jgi:hypothetical protein
MFLLKKKKKKIKKQNEITHDVKWAFYANRCNNSKCRKTYFKELKKNACDQREKGHAVNRLGRFRFEKKTKCQN